MAEDENKPKKIHKLLMETIGFKRRDNGKILSEVIEEQTIRTKYINEEKADTKNKTSENPIDSNDKKFDDKRKEHLNKYDEDTNKNDLSRVKEFKTEVQSNDKIDKYELEENNESVSNENVKGPNEDTFKTVFTVTKNETVLTKGDSKLQKIIVVEVTEPNKDNKDTKADVKSINALHNLELSEPFGNDNKNILSEVPSTANSMRFNEIIETEKDNIETIDEPGTEDEKPIIKLPEKEVKYIKPICKLPKIVPNQKTEIPSAGTVNNDSPKRIESLKICDLLKNIDKPTNITSEVIEEQSIRKENKHESYKVDTPITKADYDDKVNTKVGSIKPENRDMKIMDMKKKTINDDELRVKSEIRDFQEVPIGPLGSEQIMKTPNKMYPNTEDQNKPEENMKHVRSETVFESQNDIVMGNIDPSADIDEIFEELYHQADSIEGVVIFEDELNKNLVETTFQGAGLKNNNQNNIILGDTANEHKSKETLHIIKDAPEKDSKDIFEPNDIRPSKAKNELKENVEESGCQYNSIITNKKYLTAAKVEEISTAPTTVNNNDLNIEQIPILNKSLRSIKPSDDGLTKNPIATNESNKAEEEINKEKGQTESDKNFGKNGHSKYNMGCKSGENLENSNDTKDLGNSDYAFSKPVMAPKKEIVIENPNNIHHKQTDESTKIKNKHFKSPKVDKSIKNEKLIIVNEPLSLHLNSHEKNVISDVLASPLREPENYFKPQNDEMKEPTLSEIPKLIKDDFRPKVVDQIIKKDKESRIPRKTTSNVHKNNRNNEYTNQNNVFQGKVKRVLSKIENSNKSKNKNEKNQKQSETGVKEVEKEREGKTPVKHISITNQVKIKETHYTNKETKSNDVFGNKEEIKEHPSKNNIRTKVKDVIQKIGAKGKQGIKQTEFNQENCAEDIPMYKTQDYENNKYPLKNYDEGQSKNNANLDEIEKCADYVIETNIHHGVLENETKTPIHQKNLRHTINKDNSNVNFTKNGANENGKPKYIKGPGVKSKVKHMLRKFERKDKVPQKDKFGELIENEHDQTYNLEPSDKIDSDTNENPKDQKELFVTDSNSKVKHILKSIEKLNSIENDENTEKNFNKNKNTNEEPVKISKITSKNKVRHILKSIERLNSIENDEEVDPDNIFRKNKPQKKVTIDVSREFVRRKSVSDTIAMFENTMIKPTVFKQEPKKEIVRIGHIKIEELKFQNSHLGEMNEKENKIQKTKKVDEVNANAQESIEPAKLEDLTNVKEKFGKIAKTPVITLNNGRKIPAIALGTASIAKEEVFATIAAAIELGYRSIDCAYVCQNEQLVGDAVREKIASGDVSREDLFITSKLWNTFHRPDLVEDACRDSLDKLGLEYLDLFLIHTPMAFKEGKGLLPKIANVIQYSSADYLDTWYAMERLVQKGLVRSIGVANFNSEQITRILGKARIKPAVNQIECHPYLSQQRLVEFCEAHGIVTSSYGTLGPAAAEGGPLLFEEPDVQHLADKYGMTAAQIAYRYQLEQGRPVVVVGSSALELWEHLNSVSFIVERHDLEALDKLNRNRRFYTFEGMGHTHRDYPFKIPF